jgi:hypothetical protein
MCYFYAGHRDGCGLGLWGRCAKWYFTGTWMMDLNGSLSDFRTETVHIYSVFHKQICKGTITTAEHSRTQQTQQTERQS